MSQGSKTRSPSTSNELAREAGAEDEELPRQLISGDVSTAVANSPTFAAFVREANYGREITFVDDLPGRTA